MLRRRNLRHGQPVSRRRYRTKKQRMASCPLSYRYNVEPEAWQCRSQPFSRSQVVHHLMHLPSVVFVLESHLQWALASTNAHVSTSQSFKRTRSSHWLFTQSSVEESLSPMTRVSNEPSARAADGARKKTAQIAKSNPTLETKERICPS